MTAPFRRMFMSSIAAGIALLCCCNGPLNAGSETTSGVEIAVDETSIRTKTASGATVLLYDKRFEPDSIGLAPDTAIADGDGHASFTGLPPGKYNLFVFPEDSLVGGAAVFDIAVAGNGVRNEYTDTVPFVMLRTVVGTVSRQGQPVVPSQVFIPGSPFYAETDTLGAFVFSKVPENVYTVIVRPLEQTYSPDDTVTIDLAASKQAVIEVVIELQ